MTKQMMLPRKSAHCEADEIGTNTLYHPQPDPLSTRPTASVEAWMPTAIELLGYDPRGGEMNGDPNPDALASWQRWLDSQHSTPFASEEMFSPWLDVAVEESDAYDPIVAEYWPTN